MVFWAPRGNHRGISDQSPFVQAASGSAGSPPTGSGSASGPRPSFLRHHHWRPRCRLVRRSDDRLLAGVASGIGRWLGVDVTLVRLAFVLTTLVSGFGLLAYVVGWLLLPLDGQPGTIGARVHWPTARDSSPWWPSCRRSSPSSS